MGHYEALMAFRAVARLIELRTVVALLCILHAALLEIFVFIACRGSSKPFGGIQVLLCGDFFQVSRGHFMSSSFYVSWVCLEVVSAIVRAYGG